MTAKKCTKKRDARAKLLFCQSKLIAFSPFSLTSPSSLLKLPNDDDDDDKDDDNDNDNDGDCAGDNIKFLK